MSDIVEYLKNQATIALKNGNKLSCAALTLASQLVSATQENESLRQQLADTQRKLEAAQSRHAEEREALVKTCEWKDMGDDNMPNTYEGSCGIAWTFTEGGVEENECKFCPRCGGAILALLDRGSQG